jgi:hypothetical protein
MDCRVPSAAWISGTSSRRTLSILIRDDGGRPSRCSRLARPLSPHGPRVEGEGWGERVTGRSGDLGACTSSDKAEKLLRFNSAYGCLLCPNAP